MKEEPPAKRRLRLGKLWWWMLIALITLIGWQMWKLNAYNNAVREAREAGFEWICDDAISLIRQDWHNALKKETWGAHPRTLVMDGVGDSGRYRDLLRRLHPTELFAGGCENLAGLKGLADLKSLHLINCTTLQNVDELKDLTGLKSLLLSGCPALQNLAGLKGIRGLHKLGLYPCPALQNVDVLKSLSGLQTLGLGGSPVRQNVDDLNGFTSLSALYLNGSPALQNLDGLAGLASLQKLDLAKCDALQNVDALKGLTSLQEINLRSCDKIPAAALRELRAALPKTDITFPEGTKSPPQ